MGKDGGGSEEQEGEERKRVDADHCDELDSWVWVWRSDVVVCAFGWTGGEGLFILTAGLQLQLMST